MKLPRKKEEAIANRKLLKPQVERRRRERMNQSLESLKSLLFRRNQPQVNGRQRRVEKAEILEHTVVFLQSNAQLHRKKAVLGGGRQHTFQDGFSACLQRAAQFLGPAREEQHLGVALDASFAANFAASSADREVLAGNVNILPYTKSHASVQQKIVQRWKQRPHGHAFRMNMSASSQRAPLHPEYLRPGQQILRPNHQQTRMRSENLQNQSVSQALWRPWP
ncbi:transcription factor HES-2-like [Lampris incognitus]|uniref:transcription factor HES-2-like n=1 Tax=Lampris incognitus TaxID=2546036 RepID=UPI0024B5CEF1|nr:transcription factor HES-2-like [Lampris incognitus]